ncbi:MAG TPA: peptide chain release factor N(5)-glutamine methyltransferase [Candidatus Omnitrophota bacterium]|nr:peptide chain release factor N(5)-glutamine methyltransferase [Candidatus Omnitrophota bacterium]HPT38625.1 peptide chain release factor N(5)-glutamine methyltransferase [Candidatus Omnitrophota bacterium]
MNEAELVYSHILNCDRLSLYLNKEKRLGGNKSAQACRIFKRRITGEPLQYILGSTEFMGLEFKVDKRALIPRPETEILLSSALEKLKPLGKTRRLKILDLGTGSGCIAISAAKLLPQAQVWATDISVCALQLAKKNADLHKVKIKFLHSDIFSALKEDRDKFDLIISNPPYITRQELGGLAREISYEPSLALAGGIDGLDFYRKIILRAAAYLNQDGLLAMEVGANQANQVRALCVGQGFNILEIIKDYNNIKRVVIAKQGISANG